MLRRIGSANGNLIGYRRRVMLAGVLAVMASSTLALSAQNVTVAGVVKDPSGQPVAGAFIKIRSAESGLSFMVISQAQGRFSTPKLLPGKYTVQGFGGGQQSSPVGPVQVTDGAPVKLELVLSKPQKVYPPPKKMTDQDYIALMPEGDGKKLLLTRCVICHSPGNYVARRKSREDWRETVDKMRYYLSQNPERLKEYNAKTGLGVGPVSDQEKDTIADYLAKNFGQDKPPLVDSPSDPNQHLPRTLLKGAEGKYFAMELDLGRSTLVGSYALDSRGTVWISEKKSGILGRLDPKSFAYTRVFTPPVKAPHFVDPFATVAIDPQGMIWFTSNVVPNAQWFQYDPASNKIANTYDVPLPEVPGGDIFFNTLRFHPNGTVWATDTAYHRIVKLDPSTHKVTEYPVRYGQHPFGIAIGGDKMVWFAGDEDNLIVKVDPDTGQRTNYKLPPLDSRPRRMTTDADGNLWVNTLSHGKLVKVDYRTGKMTDYSPPTDGPGQGIDIDRKRNLIWFSEYDAVKIGRLDPRTNTFVEFPVTSSDSQPWNIEIDPTNPNRVWWNSRNGRIGYIEVTE